jgi:hypothetical protein
MCPVSPCRCPHGYGAVEITVLDPDGVPMAGALFSAAIAGTHCFTHLEGDDTGKVRFESLVTDEPYDVVIVGGLLWAVETVTPKRGEVVQRVVRLSYPEGPLAVTVDACSIPLPGSSFGSNPTPLDRPRAAGPRMASAFIEVTSPDPWVVFPRKWTARP